MVLDGSSGFVYYVSITGITGTRSATAEHLAEAIPRIRKVTDLPIAVGFGVRTPEQAAEAVARRRCRGGGLGADRHAGGALDDAGRARPDAVRTVLDQVRALADAVRSARAHA